MFFGVSLLVFGALLAGGTSTVLAGYAWYGRDEPGVTAFAVLMSGAAIWSLSYAVALVVFDPALRLAFEIPIEVGKAIIAPAWLAFALGYTGRAEYLTRRTVAAVMLFPAATMAVVALPSLRPLIWTNYQIVPTFGAATVTYDPGIWHFAHATYGYVLVGLGMALLVDTLVSQAGLYRDQLVALVLGSVVPTVAHIKRTFALGPFVPVDFTPMALAVMGLTFTYALFRFELFELAPATSYRGRQTAIDDLGIAVAIVTDNDRLVELNREAERLFGSVTAGTHLSALVLADALDGGTFNTVVDGRRRTLEVVPAPINETGKSLGRTVAFHDVTDREARRQRLEVLNRVLRHNLRNEMTVVMGYADILAESLPEEDAGPAETISARSRALAQLGEKARDLEEMMESADTTSAVDLEALIADVVDDIPPAEASVDVSVPAGLTLQTNETVLRRLLETVVENAVEHNDNPIPQVAIAVRTTSTDGGTDGGTDSDHRAILEISDDGPGIPDHELAVVSGGEETALSHGSGLGLWVVQWGSQWLGADVDFETGPDGTTVRLSL